MNQADNLMDAFWIFQLAANLFAVFFLTDFIIQSCVLKGLRPDCCGNCNNECCENRSPFFVTKLVIDGIYLFFGPILGTWIMSAAGGDGNLRMLRVLEIFTVLIFVKIVLEIAAIVVLCGACS